MFTHERVASRPGLHWVGAGLWECVHEYVSDRQRETFDLKEWCARVCVWGGIVVHLWALVEALFHVGG